MSKKTKLLACLLCLVLVGALATACQTNPKTSPTPAPSQDANAVPSFVQAGQTVRIFQWWTNDANDPYGNLDRYSRHKNTVLQHLRDDLGLKIEYAVVKDADQWGAVRSAAYTGTPLADGFHAGGPTLILDSYYYMDLPASILQNLSDYESQVSFKDPEYFDTGLQEEFGTFNGDLFFFVPKNIGSAAIANQQTCFFNYKLIENAGYTPEDLYAWNEAGQWTWERFREVATRVTDKDTGVFGLSRGAGGSTAYNLITSNNGSIVEQQDVNGRKLDRFAMHKQNTLDAYNFYVSMYNAGIVMNTDFGGDDAPQIAEFRSGNLGFMFNYFMRAANLRTEENPMVDEFGFLNIPMGPSADRYYSEQNWFEPYGAFRDGNNMATTLYVMKELYKPMYAASSEEAPYQFDLEIDDWVSDANSKKVAEAAPALVVYKRHQTYMWADSYYLLFTVILQEGQMLSGEATPSAFLSSMESTVNAWLDKIQRADVEN